MPARLDGRKGFPEALARPRRRDPMPQTDPEASAVIGQVLTFAEKLADALDDAELFGGLAGLRGKMKPATAARIAAALGLLHAEIGAELAAMKAPGREPLVRRQPNLPDPIPSAR